MSSAAKRTALAAASISSVVAVTILVGAAGASPEPRDREAPSAPENVRVVSATPTLVHVAWDDSVDNVGVVGYYVTGDKGRPGGERDSGRVTVDKPEYTVRGLECGESAVITVVAFDDSQNRSSKVDATVSTAACPDTQPPSAPSGFTQVATSETAVVLAWTPSADNVGVVEYGVYRDLQRMTTLPEPNVTISGLSCGSTYTRAVDAADAAGNRSPLATAFVRTSACAPSAPAPAPSPSPPSDTTPPSAPTGLTASSVTQTGLTLAWNASTDNVGVAGYDVYRNGAKVASVGTTTSNQTGLACGTSYALAVVARDAAGNSSSQAQLTTSTTACSPAPAPSPSPPSDTTPPSAPTGLTASSVTQTGLTLAWNASTDNVGVAGYDVYRNGAKVASVGTTTSNQTSLSCGTSYALAVVARDAAGNSSSQAQLTAATTACPAPAPPTDTTPPSMPTGLAIASAARTTVSLTWSASTDNVAVQGYQTWVNGAHGSTTLQPGSTVSGLTCGTAYTFEVGAFDAEGNRSSRASVIGSTAACADTQAPTAPASLVATSRTTTSIALSWSASSDNLGVTGYGLYRGGTLTGTSAATTGIFSGLACNTNYTLAVDAFDAAGNRSAKTTVMVSTTACPDTTPPSAPTGLAASNVTQTGLTLSWNPSTDNFGVTGYDVYRNGTKMSTVTTTSAGQSGLACGTSYTFAVRALDAAGNASAQVQLNVATSACPPPPPPPPSGCAVDPATMTAPGCSVLRSDSASSADPKPGLWGLIGAVSESRHEYMASGGDTRPKADGASQGDSAYRKLTVVDGDDYWGERAELGRNWWQNGENSGSQTSGAFALGREGDRRITFWSMRFPSGFPMGTNAWQQIGQWKQAQPYTDAYTATRNPDGSGVTLEMQMYGNQFRLFTWWQQRWATPAPPLDKWIRFAADITFSQWPGVGKVQVFIDSNADGDFLDSGERSPVWSGATLLYATAAHSGLSAGQSIPSMLALGVYHNSSAYGTTSVELDNVQVLGG